MRKKRMGILAVVTAAVLLTGCGGENAGTDSSADSAEQSGSGGTEAADGSDGAGSVEPLSRQEVEKYVTLGDYHSLSVTMDAVSVDEGELEELLNSVYIGSLNGENGGIVDRAVAAGDTVLIDYEGKKDGVAFAGGTAQNASLTIGSGQFIPGFEEGLTGVMPGETVDLDLSFPEGYGNAELAGQAVVFTVTVHCILPEKVAFEDMQDSVVASMGIPEVNTAEELREYAYDYLYARAEENYTVILQQNILGALVEQCEFGEFPEELRESYQRMISEYVASAADYYGVDEDVYTNFYFGMGSEEMIHTYAEESLQQDFAMQAVANAEGLNVSDEELQTKLLERAVSAGYSSVEEYLGSGSLEDYRDYFMNEKVLEYLTDKANITVNE